jgi:R.
MNRLTILTFFLAFFAFNAFVYAQTPRTAKEELGSATAKGGFHNEDEIRDKFNNWRSDQDAQAWLGTMGYNIADLESVVALKPHGEKADVQVRVKTKIGEKLEGISIKLVSSPNGFNQIDKRWLRQYAAAWKMPPEIVTVLRHFSGEDKPTGNSRLPNRMYLNEFDKDVQKRIVEFFTANKEVIVSDLLEGDGSAKAGWFLVAWKNSDKPKWKLVSISDTVKFFSEGRVEITRAGNLKIGRITMQRKGGDGGRETAKMLQFKLNPTLIFDDN